MLDIAAWWLAIEAIGATAFPMAFVCLRFLPDRGYNFAKIFGLVLLSYLLWLGGTIHLVPYTRWSIFLTLALLASASIALAYRHREEMAELLHLRWRQFLFSEALFTATLAVVLLLRSFAHDSLTDPNDNRFTFAFLNAIIRSEYFPPQDPWLSGHSISYYYFGFLMLGTLTKLTGIASAVTFNLSIALVPALAATGAFGIIFNLLIDKEREIRVLACGALAGALFVFVSNIEGVFELLAVHGIGSQGFYEFIDVFGLDGPRNSSDWFPTELDWTLRAHGLADGRYDSVFPFFDLILPVGYLSGRNTAVPILLLVLAGITNLWRSESSYLRNFRLESVPLIGFTSLALGALIATHAWDLPTACLLLLAAIGLRNYRREGRLTAMMLGRTLLLTAPIVVAAGLLYLPYFTHVSGQFDGILTLPGSLASKPHHHLYMWLPLFWLALCLAVSALPKFDAFSLKNPRTWLAPSLPLALFLGWAAYIAIDSSFARLWDEVELRDYRWLTVGLIAGLLTVTTFALLNQLRAAPDASSPINPAVFALLLSAVAQLLVLGIEFFYVNAITVPWSADLATVLRVNYEAWLFLSLAGAYGIYRIGANWRTSGILSRLGKGAWATVTVTAIAAGLVFPITAGFYFHKVSAGERQLDGLSFLSLATPDEYEGIRYLQYNVDGMPVLVEAVTDSAADGARISAYTGLPTVLGWKTHEFWFRGSWAEIDSREADVALLYQTLSPAEAAEILAQYDVEYVFIGRLERQLYGDAGLSKFPDFMDTVFQQGEVTIYRTRTDTAQQ